jgi:hypothetical protein
MPHHIGVAEKIIHEVIPLSTRHEYAGIMGQNMNFYSILSLKTQREKQKVVLQVAAPKKMIIV